MPKLIQVNVDPDKVEVAKQELKRPEHISVYEWMRFWETVQKKVWGAY